MSLKITKDKLNCSESDMFLLFFTIQWRDAAYDFFYSYLIQFIMTTAIMKYTMII